MEKRYICFPEKDSSKNCVVNFTRIINIPSSSIRDILSSSFSRRFLSFEQKKYAKESFVFFDDNEPDDFSFKNLSGLFADYPVDYRIFHI